MSRSVTGERGGETETSDWRFAGLLGLMLLWALTELAKAWFGRSLTSGVGAYAASALWGCCLAWGTVETRRLREAGRMEASEVVFALLVFLFGMRVLFRCLARIAG